MMKDVMCKLVIVGLLAVYGQTMYKVGKKNGQDINTKNAELLLDKIKLVSNTDSK